ncbi:hypothetical protein AVEN_220750-1 [Araneus ventricosus]|uniref:Uncharacterized protein n=1 Tax=Araneus ventricosus TaxID=182803 RepID=A0A4Y2H8R3_ARAVE|nr:hypothetical protein AVEN_182125-1 [Araneus ventricosus]GBM61581.1 hypothetical protein AVEN_220750-1 [Araneus ventricosus]
MATVAIVTTSTAIVLCHLNRLILQTRMPRGAQLAIFVIEERNKRTDILPSRRLRHPTPPSIALCFSSTLKKRVPTTQNIRQGGVSLPPPSARATVSVRWRSFVVQKLWAYV